MCTKRLPNNAHLQTRNAFPLPQVAAARTPQVDSFIKPEISQAVKTVDKELARLQTFVLDALAPLTSLLESDAKGESITHSQALDATKAATQLLGNASAQITHVWRTKVLTQLNKSLLPLLEEDSNFDEVAPSLFGPEFACKSKELVDQVKVIRSTTPKDKPPFFRQGPPKSRGGYSQRPGRGGGQQTVPTEPESSMDKQVTKCHMYVNHLLMNFKSTLVRQIACMGVNNLQLSGLPQAERLCYHLTNWSIVTQDLWVLNTVRGYLTDFVSEPHQQSAPNPPHYSSEQTSLINEELMKLLQKQAIQQLEHLVEEGFWSNIFLVPKKDGGQRPVINLKALNQFVNTEHFKMEGIHTVKDRLRHGDWLAKVDLKDTYFAIPIDPTHRRYLRCQVLGKIYISLRVYLSGCHWRVFTP